MNLDIIPNGAIKRVHVSQNDVGRTLTFELFNNSTSYTVPSGAVVKIQGTKPSGFGFSEVCSVSGNVATIDTTEAMTDESGNIQTELSISYGDVVIGTSNFVLAVERNPHPSNTTDGSMKTIIPELTLLVNEVKGYAEEIEGTYHAYGSPWVASTVAEMTDTDKIYVYTGNESGYTNGNWYYYNGTSWVSGGVYNSVAVQTDTTLSVSGKPADAKVVGDDIADLKSNINTGYITISKSLTWQSGWIRNNGNVEASSGASQYAVVQMLKGEIVEIGTNNANMCIIGSTTSESVSVGDTVTVIQATGTSGSYETHVYEAPSDMTLVLCVRASNYSLNFTKRSEALIAVEQEVAEELENLTVTSDMIDGNETVREQIENVSTKNGYYYYRSTSATLASAVGANAIGVIVPLSEFVSDDIEFDWDSSLNQSQQPIMFAVGNTEGTTIDGYFSVSEIVNASAGFQTYGGYYDSVNKKVHLSLSEITTRKPNVNYLVVSMNTTISHGVYTYVPQTRKQLKWLIASGAVPSIVVASDGSGDYTTISEAVSNAVNGDTIYIKDGEYKETVIINKYIHLVGQSKQGVVLYQDIGDYDNCPLLITQGSVCNMTIKSIAPSDTSGLSNYAYAIHLDKNFASLAKYQKCEIYNCDIYSEVNDAIGAGTNYASEYDVHDCFLHVAHNPVKSGACGFKCHNGQNQTTGKVTLRNNVIITEDANGTSCYDILYHNGGISNTQPIEVLQVGNVLKYYHNGITTIFVPSSYNYGNSVTEMNTL